jgi:hypothetical protein
VAIDLASEGGCGTTVILLFTGNSHTQITQSEQKPGHGAETNSLNSTLQVVLTKHFPEGAIRCRRSNIGLKFLLVEQILNARLLERCQ